MANHYLVSKYGWSPTYDLGVGNTMHTPIWRDIMKGLDFYCSITKVKLGNGATTTFWSHIWLPLSHTTLAQQFPALFTHSTRQIASMSRVLASHDLNLDLVPCLSYTATNELTSLCTTLATVKLNLQVADEGISRALGKPLTSKTAYNEV